MSKISFVSGSLHSISGQISEAASRMHNPQDAAEYILQEALAEVKDAYDFIIIDLSLIHI